MTNQSEMLGIVKLFWQTEVVFPIHCRYKPHDGDNLRFLQS
ncbi:MULTISPECIES: hypothetical protein [unclassified Coleofasciculus]|nr:MULTISPECIES: hypothetical protein [unclassified Coleofasciculus]